MCVLDADRRHTQIDLRSTRSSWTHLLALFSIGFILDESKDCKEVWPMQALYIIDQSWHVRRWDLQRTNANCRHFNNNNMLHLNSAFLGTQRALHSKGGISSFTTNVQHPPGWCDGSHIAPEHPPHTSLLVERRLSDEANQCVGMIRRPWWSEANGRILGN